MIAPGTTIPAALEAEAALLGAMILDGEVIPEVLQIITVGDIVKPAHAAIFTSIVSLHHAGTPINMVTLCQHLRDAGQFDQVGGFDYVLMLGESAPSTTLAPHFAGMVRQKAVARANITATEKIARAAQDGATGEELRRIAEENIVVSADAPSRGAVTVRLADVEAVPVRWLWPGRIALGKLHMLASDPGLGKSTLTIDMASRTSTGTCWPDGSANDGAGGVVMLNTEDDIADTIRPRVDAAGGDPARFTILQGVYRPNHKTGKSEVGAFSIDDDIDALEQAIKETPDCKLITVDPISAYMGETDSHNNSEVRALLARLAEIAVRYSVAVICVSHLNKGAGSAIYRTTGSLAFVAAARVAHVVVKDPDDPTGRRRLFMPVKNNIGNDSDGLAFSLRQVTPHAAAVAWEADPVQIDVNKALAGPVTRPGPEQDERVEAINWLRTRLASGPDLKRTIEEEAVEGEGISKGTLRRAKEEIGVVSYRMKNPGPWYWRLAGAHAQAHDPPPPTPEHLEHLAHLAHVPTHIGGVIRGGAADAQDEQDAGGGA